MTPSLALCVSGESVLTTMPGCTGHAHEATGFGARSTSTKHMRPFFFFSKVNQLPLDISIHVGVVAYNFLQSTVSLRRLVSVLASPRLCPDQFRGLYNSLVVAISAKERGSC